MLSSAESDLELKSNVLCDILKHALLMTCMFQPEFTHMTHYSP